MTTAGQHLEFAPQPQPGLVRAALLALSAHLILLAILAHGIQWKRDTNVVTAEAELWSAIPQQAAAAETSPQPSETIEAIKPAPVPQQSTEALPEASISLEKEKVAPPKESTKSKADKPQASSELDELDEVAVWTREQKRREALKLKDQEKAAKEKAEKDKAERERSDKESVAKRAKEEAKRLEEIRQQNLKRMAGLAGATGGVGDVGASAQASGPSAGYMGRIVGRIKPNIVFTDTIAGNPRAEVEIRVSPIGTILSAKVTQSSGIKAWDDAVLRAIEKTEVLPKDLDGSIPTLMAIGFRPKD